MSTNLTTAEHLSSLASAVKGKLNVLDTLPATVNGGLWLEGGGSVPIIKLFYGDNTYKIATELVQTPITPPIPSDPQPSLLNIDVELSSGYDAQLQYCDISDAPYVNELFAELNPLTQEEKLNYLSEIFSSGCEYPERLTVIDVIATVELVFTDPPDQYTDCTLHINGGDDNNYYAWAISVLDENGTNESGTWIVRESDTFFTLSYEEISALSTFNYRFILIIAHGQ